MGVYSRHKFKMSVTDK